MTQVHPGINIRLQYIRNTSEYILKLELHQHSLLARKIFSRHNLLAQVFFSVSSGLSLSPHHLHLQVISIFKSPSSSSNLHLDLDHHHQIQIIPPSGSYLDMDHPSIQIISVGSSSLYHHGCYLMILLITGSSTEPALSHVGCRPSLHVGLLQGLYLTLGHNGPPSTYI